MKLDLDTRLRRVEDELAIRGLAARFSDCANARDYDGFADLWSAKAVWEIGSPHESRAVGVDAIVAMLERLLGTWSGFLQMTHPGVVRLDGDRATARFAEHGHGFGLGADRGDSFFEALAIHHDVLVREIDGKWRFEKRTYLFRCARAAAFGGRRFGLPPATAIGS